MNILDIELQNKYSIESINIDTDLELKMFIIVLYYSMSERGYIVNIDRYFFKLYDLLVDDYSIKMESDTDDIYNTLKSFKDFFNDYNVIENDFDSELEYYEELRRPKKCKKLSNDIYEKYRDELNLDKIMSKFYSLVDSADNTLEKLKQDITFNTDGIDDLCFTAQFTDDMGLFAKILSNNDI